MKNSKSPGVNGLPADFYKFFWQNIKHLVLASINYALNHGELSINQKRGIITLIPKKDKDRSVLKNWRPLTLLTTDYKLVAKTLALRVSKVIPNLINSDQTAYVKGRYIGENIRTIADIIEYCKRNNLTGILLLIDFEKAFDTVRWSFLFKTLKTFNFGDNFIKWSKTLYTNPLSTVCNNGYFSEYFKLERGIRQGCPLSAYLFILVVEMLAINIRNNKEIHGISVQNRIIKIRYLADDTTFILNETKSINPSLETLECFYKHSGLKTNLEKTQVFTIGKKLNHLENIPGLDWSKGPIKLLGITLCDSENDNYKYNFEHKIKTIKNLLNLWKSRNLSLKGKITVLNSLASSMLIYPCTVIETPVKVLKEVSTLFYNFLWDGKTPKIAKDTITKSITDGGLKMINFEKKVESWKFIWIKKAVTKPLSSWKIIVDKMIPNVTLDYLINCPFHYNDLKAYIPPFYLSILNVWETIHGKEPKTVTDILSQNLWYNKFIRIGGSPIHWPHWIERGILKINDLLDNNGQFMSMEKLCETFDIRTNFLRPIQIKNAIPLQWRHIIQKEKQTLDTNLITKLTISITNRQYDLDTIPTKQVYWILVNSTNYRTIPAGIKRWENHYRNIEINWKEVYLMAFRSCRETNIQSFQYKIIHHILPCNEWLYQKRVIDSNLCNYCGNTAIDTLQHHLVMCPNTQIFWNKFVDWWNFHQDSQLNPLLEIDILLGRPGTSNTDLVLNFCTLYGKYYIYITKRNKKNIFFLEFLSILKDKLLLEEYIYLKERKEHQFYEKWGCVFDIL